MQRKLALLKMSAVNTPVVNPLIIPRVIRNFSQKLICGGNRHDSERNERRAAILLEVSIKMSHP